MKSRYLVLLLLINAFLAQHAWADDSLDALQLFKQRNSLDQTIWNSEVEAQRHEAVFTKLWDSLLNAKDPYRPLALFPFDEILMAPATGSQWLDLQIRKTAFGEPSVSIDAEAWYKLLRSYRNEGYFIEHTEWHHSQFKPAIDDQLASSVISMSIHAASEKHIHRVMLHANLKVDWSGKYDAEGLPSAKTIFVNDLKILDRQSKAAFKEVFKVKGSKENPLVLPVHTYDMNGDGLSEIIVGGQNMLIQNNGEGSFKAERMIPDMPPIYDAAILEDFTGDGIADYIAVGPKGYPLIFKGQASGGFEGQGTIAAQVHFKQPKTFTAGDIDSDGDLDLFIANYKYAYRQGQWPTPYFDANDGYPAFMLENDGTGQFKDVTESSGLAPKRFRRTYSSSLFDLDDDHDLDLVVVSDYAGMDMYLNDGRGKFTDISDSFGKDRHFFGMGHTFADFNGDGLQDLYVIGMSSTTARRLESMGLARPDKPEFNEMRALMGYGNRLFLKQKKGYKLAPYNDEIARTGWSWGASTFDFDNDGDEDLFVTNGHYSGKSTQDYCTTFWRHDIYTEGSKPDFEMDKLFQNVSSPLRKADISWNGYEHKVLFMNDGNEHFTNIAYLLGVAFEYDARSVITDDLDADGRVDLLVVEFATKGLDENNYVVHVYRNELEEAGHWIGVNLQGKPGLSPIGATVKLVTKKGKQVKRLVTGDSFSAQHSQTVHFGLGQEPGKVKYIEVQWSNGKKQKIRKPEIDQYHKLKAR